jgi:hypothetical protein
MEKQRLRPFRSAMSIHSRSAKPDGAASVDSQRDGAIPPSRGSVLCVGTDASLLVTRCAVLTFCGFEAVYVLPENVSLTLAAGAFDLVIADRMLSESQKTAVQAAVAGKTRILALHNLILPDELQLLVIEALRSAPPLPNGNGSEQG